MHVYYEITNQCNLACSYCYNDSGKAKAAELSFDEMVKAFSLLKNEHNLRSITLSGGEPLLHPDFEAIVRLLSSKGIRMLVITNGTLLNRYSTELFSCIDRVFVSLHGKYEDVLDATYLRRLAKICQLVFSVVLNKTNFHQVDQYQRFADDLNVEVSYILQTSGGRGNNANLLDVNDALSIRRENPNLYKKLFHFEAKECSYFNSKHDIYTMCPDGTMHLCSVLPRIFPMGSVFGGWHDKRKTALTELRASLQAYRTRICKKCLLSAACMGLCPEVMLNSEKMSYFCELKLRTTMEKVLG